MHKRGQDGHDERAKRLGWMKRMFGRGDVEAMLPLYDAVVERGRAEHWYLDGAVPDTVDGRFDMIAAVLALVLLRLEREPEGAAPGVWLAERFVDDMDGQLRQLGIGDIIVGKHIGRMMAMLGGRLGAYRDALASTDRDAALDAALSRNLYRGTPPDTPAVAHVRDSLVSLSEQLAAAPIDSIIAGTLP